MAKGFKSGGRKPGTPNKVTLAIKAIAAPYGEEAVEALANIMRHSDSDQAKVAAAKELLDRGFGKAKQPLGGEEDGSPVPIALEWRIVDPAS